MRIRFGLAYSPLWERSTSITRAHHDVILFILPRRLAPKILAWQWSGDNQVLTHQSFFLFVLFFFDNCIIMLRNVIDDTYLEKLVNLL